MEKEWLGKNPFLYSRYKFAHLPDRYKNSTRNIDKSKWTEPKRKVFHRKYFIIRTVWFPRFKIYLLCYFYK